MRLNVRSMDRCPAHLLRAAVLSLLVSHANVMIWCDAARIAQVTQQSTGNFATILTDDATKRDPPTFVLVHGSFHGAWCWYKVLSLLQKAGYNAKALDLTSLGRSKFSADSVSTMAQLTRPVTDYLSSISGKVVIVGHSTGGFVISYIMELFSDRIEKAVFLAASMPVNGESHRGIEPTETTKTMLEYNYADGPDAPPTSFFVNSTIAVSFFYSKSPLEVATPTKIRKAFPSDVTLALSLLVPQPLKPFREALSLSEERYGRVRRFFIKTSFDGVENQEDAINKNPPERVFEIVSDHSAFFSDPRGLAALLVQIDGIHGLCS